MTKLLLNHLFSGDLPRSRALSAALIAVDTTRSLNDSVGCDTASFFTHTRATPRALRRRRRVFHTEPLPDRLEPMPC